jgi:hypothetical protein
MLLRGERLEPPISQKSRLRKWPDSKDYDENP